MLTHMTIVTEMQMNVSLGHRVTYPRAFQRKDEGIPSCFRRPSRSQPDQTIAAVAHRSHTVSLLETRPAWFDRPLTA